MDTMQVLKESTNPILSERLGFPCDWVGFVASNLAKSGMNPRSSAFEDMTIDIISSILMSIDQGGRLAELIQEAKKNACEDKPLLNQLKALMVTAVRFRFMDFRTKSQYQHEFTSMPDMFDVEEHTKTTPASQIEVNELEEKIHKELNSRGNSKIIQAAKKMLPDRIAGMGFREICKKHGLSRGALVCNALKEIYNVVKIVCQQFGQDLPRKFVDK